MPLLGLGLGLGKQGGVTSSPAPNPYDPDAFTWFNAVQTAGGTVSDSNKTAISKFFSSLKSGGVFDSIKQSNLFAGSSTRTGALVPIAGVNVTSNAFTDADYSSTLGLTGNGTSKYINTNRANNAAADQNSRHLYVFLTALPTLPVASSQYLLGSGNAGAADARIFIPTATSNVSMSLAGLGTFTATAPTFDSVNGIGIARNSASTVVPFINANLSSVSNATVTPTTGSIGIFGTGTGASRTSARIGFYSIGSYADLSVIDTAVKTLFSQLT